MLMVRLGVVSFIVISVFLFVRSLLILHLSWMVGFSILLFMMIKFTLMGYTAH